MAEIRVLTTDVLVIGCGLAGLLTSLEAKKKGCDVIAIDKGIIGNDCATVGAKQIAATGPWSSEDDSPEVHFEDTIKSGCFINDEKLTRLLVNRIGSVINDLQKIGMPFSRDETGQNISVVGPSAGHSKPRSLYFSDITGKLLIDTIYAECRRRRIRMYSEHIALELIKGENGIAGALVFDLTSGEIILIRAKATVIATGGIGRLYELTSNPAQSTGDGIALAMRAGADLMDLEFVQFYPCTVLYPQGIRGMNLNSQYYGARLYNSEGERFMSKYFPEHMEKVTRDKLSRSIFKEIQAGKVGPNGGVYLDATMIPGEYYAKNIPTEWKLAVSVGLDLTKEKLEIAPSCHYFMGGVKIDENCRTSVKGLFATGECTSGVQGANRLANNGLAEALVFGVLAGETASQYAFNESLPHYQECDIKDKISQLRSNFKTGGENSLEIVTKVQKAMYKYIGVLRDEDGLKKGNDILKELGSLKIDGNFDEVWSPKILHGISLRNMIMLGKAIAEVSLERKESRGAHYRLDYPETDDEKWRANIVVNVDEQGKMVLRRENVGGRRCMDWESIQ